MATGWNRRPWGMSGFSGFQAGQIQLGKRNDECIVRLSGDGAARWWRKAYQLSDKVTRFDVQVTHINDSSSHERIMDHWKEASAYSDALKHGPYVTIINSNDGTDTLYLGKRQSSRYGRVYSSGRQKQRQHELESVRYEVEFKEKLGYMAARHFSIEKHEPVAAIDLVAGFFGDRGLTLPFSSNRPIFLKDSVSISDLEKSLVWLRSQVAPTCRRILEHGRLPELLDALGLAGDIGPPNPMVQHKEAPDFVN